MRKGVSAGELRLAFAGDRDIAVWVLDFLLAQGVRPLALLLSDEDRASHAPALRRRCRYLPEEKILLGARFREPRGIELLRGLRLDYIIGVHFPYIVPPVVLDVSGRGFLNLHPAYLPFNPGWHTPSWAILDGTPAGATLHFIDEGLDSGDIVLQKQLRISEEDTAHTLYGKMKLLELEMFRQAWPQLLSRRPARIVQASVRGTFHRRRDLFQPEIQQIDLDAPTTARGLIDRMRALTTDRIEEAAYFEADGKRHRVQIVISCEKPCEAADGGASGDKGSEMLRKDLVHSAGR